MRLYFYSTPRFQKIRNQFVSSLKEEDEWQIKELKLDDFSASEKIMGGGIDSSFVKVGLILQGFEETKPDEVFVFSDIDIVFYSKCKQIILHEIQGKDIVFQRETKHHGVNSGFIAIRNNFSSKKFWEDINSRIKRRDLKVLDGGSKELEEAVDQCLANILLYDNYHPEISWGRFPSCFWNWSQGDLKPDIVLHHANWAVSLEQKINQFEYVRNFIDRFREFNKSLEHLQET